MYLLTLQVAIDAETLEQAKDNAINYLNNVKTITNDELQEVK